MNLQRHLVSAILCSGLLLSVVTSGESQRTAESSQSLFDGIGSIHHPVSTTSSLAQRYFDQGLAFTYGFNHDETERSFERSATIDRNLAMAYPAIANGCEIKATARFPMTSKIRSPICNGGFDRTTSNYK
jgi:hypothetical protein